LPQIERVVEDFRVTILNGQSLSDAVSCDGGVIISLQVPAVWTNAALTFEGSVDGTTFGPVYDDAGVEVLIAAGSVIADRVIVNSTILEKLAGLRAFRLRSGSVGAPVAQAGDRIFRVVIKG
jgi:hypothetical protein